MFEAVIRILSLGRGGYRPVRYQPQRGVSTRELTRRIVRRQRPELFPDATRIAQRSREHARRGKRRR
jgi:hypothetical protein